MSLAKIGVIGVGALGRHHTRLYAANKNADLVGIYDADPDAAKKVAAEFGTRVFQSMEELAAACDGLSVAVPSNLHHQVAMPLIAAKKHLLIEKPLADKVADGEKMVKAAADAGVILGVGHVERFNPVMSFFENMAEKIRFIECHRLAPYPPERPGLHRRGTEVSVILDLMIHDLEILLHLVGADVEQIDANGFPALSDTEDVANARIRFTNGCVANITASRIAPGPMRKFRIFYADAYVSLDYGERTGIMYTKDETEMKVNRDPIPVNDHNALEQELDDFVACISQVREGAKLPTTRVSGEHALKALQLAIQVENHIRSFNRQYGFFTDSYK